MAPEDDLARLRDQHHDLAGRVQHNVTQLALIEAAARTLQGDVARLRESGVTEEELTAALGPLRGELALHRQEMNTMQSTLGHLESTSATKDGLTNALSLVRSDAANIQKDVSAIQDSLRWITRTLVGSMVAGVITIIVKVAQR